MKKGNILLKVIAVLAIILLSLISFLGIYRRNLNMWENVIPKFQFSKELGETRIYEFTVDTTSTKKIPNPNASTEKNEEENSNTATVDSSEETLQAGESENSEPEISNETKLTFRISPFSFFQTNTLWAEKLFWTAFNMLWNIEWNLLDLYCWAGSIGLSLLKQNNGKNKDSELIWIEIVEDAIRDANVNANINWLENQSFFVASPCEKVLNKFPELEEKIKNIWVVVVDPPREWLHPNVIDWIGKLKKEYKFKLLYISCNPVTMARDIEMLVNEQWFSTKEVQPVDMFPHTHHIEDVCVLE